MTRYAVKPVRINVKRNSSSSLLDHTNTSKNTPKVIKGSEFEKEKEVYTDPVVARTRNKSKNAESGSIGESETEQGKGTKRRTSGQENTPHKRIKIQNSCTVASKDFLPLVQKGTNSMKDMTFIDS